MIFRLRRLVLSGVHKKDTKVLLYPFSLKFCDDKNAQNPASTLALNFALGHIVGFARICWRKRYKLLLRTPILGDSRLLPAGAIYRVRGIPPTRPTKCNQSCHGEDSGPCSALCDLRRLAQERCRAAWPSRPYRQLLAESYSSVYRG